MSVMYCINMDRVEWLDELSIRLNDWSFLPLYPMDLFIQKLSMFAMCFMHGEENKF